MEMMALIRTIDKLKELMITNNITHIEINKYQENKDGDSDEVVDNFMTDIHQDDRNMSYYKGGYRRY